MLPDNESPEAKLAPPPQSPTVALPAPRKSGQGPSGAASLDFKAVEKIAPPATKPDPQRIAWLTCLAYAGAGTVWIFLSDKLLMLYSSDPATISRLQTCKGWVFVAVTAAFLYAILLRQLRRWEQESTRRKEIEADLELVRRLIDRSSDAIFVADVETGRLLDANETACRQRGYTRDELCRMTVPEISETMTDDYRWEHFVAAIKVAGSMIMETTHKRKDGTKFAVEANVSYVQQGGAEYLIASLRDISERQRTQAELQRTAVLLEAVAEGTTDAVFVKDRDGRYLFFNKAAARFVGRPVEEVLGKDDLALFSAEGARFVMDRDRQVILSGRPQTDEETLTAAGVTRTYLAAKAPFRNSRGEIIGLIGISRDISDRIRIEEALRDIAERKAAELAIRKTNADLERRIHERTRDLEEANHELEAFSYSVSHDLRSPLRHVQGYVQLLQRTSEGQQLSEKALRYLRIISEASQEMGQLIDDLLGFSRMSRAEMSETLVPLDDLVRETIHSLDPATKGRNIDWQIGPLPEVLGDAAMLKLVLVNLLGNAVKYTRPRDPARIELGAAPAEGGLVSIFVRDNGVGFDMAFTHKLFGVFQRLHRAEEFEGTGIGLATVRRIVARHGGSVTAEGKLDQGASFHFTLKSAAAAPTSPPPLI